MYGGERIIQRRKQGKIGEIGRDVGVQKTARGTRQEYTNSNTILYSPDKDYFIRVRPVTGNKLGEGGRAEQRRCPKLQLVGEGGISLTSRTYRSAPQRRPQVCACAYSTRWMRDGWIRGRVSFRGGSSRSRSGQGPWSWTVQVQTDAWRVDSVTALQYSTDDNGAA